MNPTVHAYTIICLVFFAATCATFRFKQLDRPSKIIAALLIIALLTELTSLYAVRQYGTNMPVYNVYSIIELVIITRYFEAIGLFRNKVVANVVTLLIPIVGIANIVIIQPITDLNTHFLLFEGFLVIALSLFAFYKFLLNNEDLQLKSHIHFWIVTFLLFFWTMTYMYWGLSPVVIANASKHLWILHFALLIANAITYIGLGTTFIYFKRMKTTNG